MNKNPRLIKNFLIGKIPFMKDKTKNLYSKYISGNKLVAVGESIEEVLSTYSIGNDSDLILDSSNITSETFFTEEEWVYLGLVLRAYKEVENISLLHLYNCLYKSENKTSYGHMVRGRKYTLYSNTQFPVKLFIEGKKDPIVFNSLQSSSPKIIEVPIDENQGEELVKIRLEFSTYPHHQASLFEGEYGEIIQEVIFGKIKPSKVIPEQLKEGEYSDKLVEFCSGTLITPLSNDRLLSSLSNSLVLKNGETLESKVKEITPGIFNIDGYMDRRVNI